MPEGFGDRWGRKSRPPQSLTEIADRVVQRTHCVWLESSQGVQQPTPPPHSDLRPDTAESSAPREAGGESGGKKGWLWSEQIVARVERAGL